MSSRPFLAHTDLPTPAAPSRPAFVPALRLGGGSAGGGPVRTTTSNAPVRAAHSIAPSSVVKSVASVKSSFSSAPSSVAVASNHASSSSFKAPPPAAGIPFGGAGGSRMAFKPGGGNAYESNHYIYRPPTNLYRPAGSPPPPTNPSTSPPPSKDASGITRGPPSANESKLIGGPNRDYQFPSKADYTPIGPKNAPYATYGPNHPDPIRFEARELFHGLVESHSISSTVCCLLFLAAGGRPAINGFRGSVVPSIRSVTRRAHGPRGPRRPKARKAPTSSNQPTNSGSGAADGDASDEAGSDADRSGEDEPDETSHEIASSFTLKPGTARPSSAFRGVSPRAPPPEAFEPDWQGLGQIMTVTSRKTQMRGLPGAGKRSKTSSKASSKAPSVAGTERGSLAPKPSASVAIDPDDPFASDAADAIASGDVNAASSVHGNETPKSHRSVASHTSHVSKATSQHSAGWYTRQFHLTGNLENDMKLLQEKAAMLQQQMEEQKRINDGGKPHEEEKEATVDNDGGDGEEEVFAQDGEEQPNDSADEKQDEDESVPVDENIEDESEQPAEADEGQPLPEDDLAQQEADELAAEADEAAAQARDEDEDGHDLHDDSVDVGHEDGSGGSDFQPDDLDDDGEVTHKQRRIVSSGESENDLPEKSDEDEEKKAPPALTVNTSNEPPRKVLRPSNKLQQFQQQQNAWASREPLVSPPYLHTPTKWGEETKLLQQTQPLNRTGYRPQPTQTNGNETSDIDTEQDTEAEQDEPIESKSADEEEQTAVADEENDQDQESSADNQPATHDAANSEPELEDGDESVSVDDLDGSPDSSPLSPSTEMNSTALFVVHAPLHSTQARSHATKPGASPLTSPLSTTSINTASMTIAATGAFTTVAASTYFASDSEDESGPSATTSIPSSALIGTSKSFFANLMQGVNKKASVLPTLTTKPPTPKKIAFGTDATIATAAPPASTSSTTASSTAAATPTSASAAPVNPSTSLPPPPVVDYMAVLKRKGVAPVLEVEKKEAADTTAKIVSTEMTLAQLRQREKEIMELKWKQIQASEQASSTARSETASTARSDVSEDPFAPPSPTATTAVPSTRSTATSSSGSNAIIPPSVTSLLAATPKPAVSNPQLQHSSSLEKFQRQTINVERINRVRYAMAPSSPPRRESPPIAQESPIVPPQSEHHEIPTEADASQNNLDDSVPSHHDLIPPTSSITAHPSTTANDSFDLSSSEIPPTVGPSHTDPFQSDDSTDLVGVGASDHDHPPSTPKSDPTLHDQSYEVDEDHLVDESHEEIMDEVEPVDDDEEAAEERPSKQPQSAADPDASFSDDDPFAHHG